MGSLHQWPQCAHYGLCWLRRAEADYPRTSSAGFQHVLCSRDQDRSYHKLLYISAEACAWPFAPAFALAFRSGR